MKTLKILAFLIVLAVAAGFGTKVRNRKPPPNARATSFARSTENDSTS